MPETLREASALVTLGDKPLVIVAASVDTQPGWIAAHEAMVALYTNASYRLASGHDHGSLIMSEAGAVISSTAILDVVASVRGAPGAP